MKRKYDTELDRASFLLKLETYSSFNFWSAPIKGKSNGQKGILECGLKDSKKFSIEFIDEKQIEVKSHICITEIILFCVVAFMFFGGCFLSIYEKLTDVKLLIICLVCVASICLILLVINLVFWNKIDKVLTKEFMCIRKP